MIVKIRIPLTYINQKSNQEDKKKKNKADCQDEKSKKKIEKNFKVQN